jgi:hypothetical protein
MMAAWRVAPRSTLASAGQPGNQTSGNPQEAQVERVRGYGPSPETALAGADKCCLPLCPCLSASVGRALFSHLGGSMTDFRINKVILSPEDVATHRQWRQAVCAIYAGIILILATTWGVHQLVMPGDDAQIAGSSRLAPAMEANRGEPEVRRQ